MKIDHAHFDGILDDVLGGKRALTEEEREFLVTDTPHFEECDSNEEYFRSLDDITLMRECYWVWADYCR